MAAADAIDKESQTLGYDAGRNSLDGSTLANGSGNEMEVKYGIPAGRKILYQTIAILLSLSVIYVTIALLLYNWLKSSCTKNRERNRSSMKVGGPSRRRSTKDSCVTSDSSASTVHSSGRSKSSAARNSRILRFMCVCASVLTFIRLASEQLEILPATGSRVDCRDYQITMVVTYAIAISMIYGILWYRVRIFLSHPAMRHLGSKILTILVFVVLAVIIVATVLNAIMFLITTVSFDNYGGCIVLSPGNLLSNDLRFAILTVTTVLSQGSLLGLFLYPLIRHNAAMRAGKIATPVAQKKTSNESLKMHRTQSVKSTLGPGTWTRSLSRRRRTTKRQRREIALLKIIKRVLITAAACALSDIFSGLIVQVVKHEPRVVTNLIYDVNLVVNLACVIMSFKDWRVRIFPCCVPQRKAKLPHPTPVKRPSSSSSKDRKMKMIEAQDPSSPAGFTSRESSATQGNYHTSDSGMQSPREDHNPNGENCHSVDMTASEETVQGKSD